MKWFLALALVLPSAAARAGDDTDDVPPILRPVHMASIPQPTWDDMQVMGTLPLNRATKVRMCPVPCPAPRH